MDRFVAARNNYLRPTGQPHQFNTWLENAARAGHVNPPGGHYDASLPQRSRANMDKAIQYHARMKAEREALLESQKRLNQRLTSQDQLMAKATARIKELEAQNSKLKVTNERYDSQPASAGPSQHRSDVPGKRRVTVQSPSEPSVRLVGDDPNHDPESAGGGGGGEPDGGAMPGEVLPA